MKHTLGVEYEISFDLIGISSYLPDYRLTWLINTTFGLRLSRTEDILITPSGKDKGDSLFHNVVESESFATYSYLKEDQSEEVRLIANRHNGHTLLKAHPRVDFFLRIDSSEYSTSQYVKRLLDERDVQTVRRIDTDALKDDIDIFYTNE